MKKKLSRRELLKGGALAAVGLALGRCLIESSRPPKAQENEPTFAVYMPYISKQPTQTPTFTPTATPTSTSTATPRPTVTPPPVNTPTPTNTPVNTSTPANTPTPTNTPTPVNTPAPGSSRVVHVYAPGATYWDYGSNHYSNYISQSKVNDMVDAGVKALTGESTVAAAWQKLIPGYEPGKAIAIKVNFNNSFYCTVCETDCADWRLKIDALIHPINAVIRGIKEAYSNLQYGDIWVYDATVGNNPPVSERRTPNNIFTDRCWSLYPGVRFFDAASQYPCTGVERATYNSSDPSATVTWHNPTSVPAPPTVKVTDVLVNATYLINMPIMKRHGAAGITLSFKNHLGSIANPYLLHDWVFLSGANYAGESYSVLVDLYRNSNIVGKTVLTVGDALLGNWESNDTKPQPWSTFENKAPDSLFFSTDPVAVDCVMADFLDAEFSLPAAADDYLVYAAACGLGTCERGDPWGSGYTQIDYLKITQS